MRHATKRDNALAAHLIIADILATTKSLHCWSIQQHQNMYYAYALHFHNMYTSIEVSIGQFACEIDAQQPV